MKKRILIITPDLDRNAIGEANMNYQFVKAISSNYELTILTLNQKDGKNDINNEFSGCDVIQWDAVKLFRRCERFNAMAKPYFIPFYVHAREWIKRNYRKYNFSLIHQTSPLAMRYPCPASSLGYPYVIGPLGGSLPSPKNFYNERMDPKWYLKLRSLDKWRWRWDPFLRASYENASALILAAPYVADQLHASLKLGKYIVMSELGIDNLPDVTARRGRINGKDVRLLYVGRVVRSKGLRDVIRAMATIKEMDNIHLDVVGDGHDMAHCKREAKDLGVSGYITFHGAVDQDSVKNFYLNSDIFVFPSFREPSGRVVMESMSYGLPVIVADRGGPAFVVDDDCGIKIAVKDPIQLSNDIADAIVRLSADRSRRNLLGAGARRRAEDIFLWSNKIRQIDILYSQVEMSTGT